MESVIILIIMLQVGLAMVAAVIEGEYEFSVIGIVLCFIPIMGAVVTAFMLVMAYDELEIGGHS